jgi:hypothetical protein
MTSHPNHLAELERIKRVADTLCTAHAGLYDRYSKYAFGLDILTLALSTWLAALAFVDPRIGRRLTPLNFDSTIWIGLLAIATFFLTLIQMKADLKGRADSHRRALETYSAVKREAGYAIGASFDEVTCRRVMDRYDMAGVVSVSVPEGEFVRQKRRHYIKISMSKHIDTHPFVSLTLLRFKLWWRDNFSRARDEE